VFAAGTGIKPFSWNVGPAPKATFR
jgi:hypothetical protein